jgi:hypothetical protein
MNEVAIERARQDWRHWRGAVNRLFSAVPSLTLYGSYRGKLMFIGGRWTNDDESTPNDNKRRDDTN